MTRIPDAIEDDLLDVILACRPVYSRGQEVAAFELLLQGEEPSQRATLSDIEASSQVILGTYTQLFQAGRVRRVPSFLKVTDEVIMAPELPDLPKDHYILEIPEGMLLTSDRVERLSHLAQRGYRLALADYDPDDAELDVLLDVVHIVKVDTRLQDDGVLRRAADKSRDYGVEMLADNLDSRERFLRCVELGFDYYQGDFLSAPSPVKGKKITGNKILLLQLLSELHSPEASPLRLEAIALKDANLTYRILKVVNSAAVGLRREVNSLSHAIGLMGLEEIKRWANLFLVAGESDKPEALTRSMLVRGRMCEVLAEIAGRDNTINHFIVGLLSQLDALMDIAMPELMKQVPLNKEVKSALLERSGSLGEILGEVERYEQGRFDELEILQDTRYYEAAYRHATAWARQVQQAMNSGNEAR
ncbi:EAL and HDOD domain-containing protein [Microbulbifer magnicolonia]|uniref:EAL and HDOD domain-containing protein n=1 Tax=Microbulbifer magnicolonia TaxID=3109744 RepID=UPI002B411071|nr:HDOD domain-containing protein [Microbulbifer sp. GG15]